MGFIDWILEPAAEAGGQYHDAIRGPVFLAPERFDCPYCDQDFASEELLDRHTHLTHPLAFAVVTSEARD